MSKRIKIFIKDSGDEIIGMRGFKQHSQQEIDKDYVNQSYLVKNKMLTLKQIKNYESSGDLEPLLHKNKKYYKREKVIELMRKNK